MRARRSSRVGPWSRLLAGALVLVGCGSTTRDPIDCGTGAPRWQIVDLPDQLNFQFGQYPAEILPNQGFEPGLLRYADGGFWFDGKLMLWNGISGATWDPAIDATGEIPTFDGAADVYGQFVGLAGGALVVWGVPWSGPGDGQPQDMRGSVYSVANGWQPMAGVPDTAGLYVSSSNPSALWGTHGNDFYYIAFSRIENNLTQSASRLASYDVSSDTWLLIDNPAGVTPQSVAVPMADRIAVETPRVYTDASNTQQVELWTELDDQSRQWSGALLLDPRTDISDSRIALGSDVMVWPFAGNQGWAYSTVSRQMRALSTDGAPDGGTIYAAGSRAVVASDGWYLYDPPSDAWTRLPDQCAPERGPVPGTGPGFAVWTDYGLLVWNLDSTNRDRRGQGRLLITDPARSWGGK